MDLSEEALKVAKAVYDIRPNMVGAMALAKAIDEMIVARITEATGLEPMPDKRKPGRPRKDAA